ncbi:MAG: twin-arginine translocation pathway signal [Synechococcus sp.]|nr:twin-arginine translocation pathway signal [Synechococcus sp.]
MAPAPVPPPVDADLPPGPILSRRQWLQRSGRGLLTLASGALLAPALGGCRRGTGPELAAAAGSLPAAWVKQLPEPWRLASQEDPAAVLEAPTALAALSDGWATSVPTSRWQPLGAPALLARLAPLAAPVSRLFQPEGAAPLAYPWAFSPWVIVLRSRPDLAARAGEGWRLLFDTSLRGRLVLPSSPRLVMQLAAGGADALAVDLDQLRGLRRQALALDERDGLNLLLAGEAEAAVLPAQRVVPLLRRDPRLRVVLPATGAPLAWSLLLRPAGGQPAPPLEWLGAVLEGPLLARLLAGGWVPPLPEAALQPALAGLPASMAKLLLPPADVLARCWSLPPLDLRQRLMLQNLWDAAAR